MLHDSLHVRRFIVHHHVADEEGQHLAQAAQEQLLDGELEAALMRLSGSDEIVLVRRLQTRVRLRAQHSDRDNARQWSDALAASLSHTLQHAGPQDLLRFGGRAEALHAFVSDVLNGRSVRDWAWQRLSLLPANSARSSSPAQRHEALLRLLAEEPDEGVPLLRGLLHSPLWPRLIEALDDGDLRGRTQSALARLAGPQAPGFGAEIQCEPNTVRVAADTRIRAQWPAWVAGTLQAARTPPRTRWALRLGCLLASPSLARRGAAAVDAQLRDWAAEPTMKDEDGFDAGHAHAHVGATAAWAKAQHATEPSSSVAEGIDASDDASNDAGDDAGDDASKDASSDDARIDSPIEACTGHTAFGGLLLLAPLLPVSGALKLLEEPTVWPAGTLPLALHQLALRLWPLAPGDAAVQAFCGLAPAAPIAQELALSLSPSLALSGAQQENLQAARQCLLQHLSDRLAGRLNGSLNGSLNGRLNGSSNDGSLHGSSAGSADALAAGALALVVPRRARIRFDPGWIDVHFSLRDVSLDLRRAALDLDPGFLPWLGVVLRYRYE